MEATATLKARHWPALAALAALFVGSLAALYGWHWYVGTYQPRSQLEARLAAAQDVVKLKLLDPYSARFTDVVESRVGICGQVNAKNQLGAYTGPRQFVLLNDGKAPIVDQGPAGPASAICRSSGEPAAVAAR